MSNFITCTFEIYKETNKISNTQGITFVRLNGVKGVRLLGNTFTTNYFGGAIKQPHERPTAIFSINSSFVIDNYCADWPPPISGSCQDLTRSTFSNLFYGIKAYNYSPLAQIKINGALFHNAYRGIYFNAVDNSQISNCDFELMGQDNGWTPPVGVDKQPYGVYLDASTGFLFTKNSFNMSGGTGGVYVIHDENYGVIINNSGDQTNYIYDNEFWNQKVGIAAQNWNRSTVITTDNNGDQSNDGLKIKCNDFWSNVKKNIIVTSDNTPQSNYGISVYQGKSMKPNESQEVLAGNRFTKDATYTLTNYQNDFSSAHIHYYCHNYTYYPITFNLPEWVPEQVTGLSVHKQSYANGFDKTKACPTALTNTSVVVMQTEKASIYNQWQSAKLIYAIWVNGGNTDLPDDIQGAYPWETYQLYNDLMSESPYLSEGAIIEAINNTSVLPEALLKLIIIANPHVISSPEVVDAMHNRIPALSQTTLDQIMGHIDDYSPLRDLTADVAYWAQEYYLKLNEIKRSYVADTLNVWAVDSLCAMLSRESKASLKLEQASIYFYRNNTEGYNTLLNNLNNLQRDDSLQKAESLSFFNAIDNFDYRLSHNYNIDEQYKNQLLNLANSGKSKYAAYARTVLYNIDMNYSYYEPIYDNNVSSSRIAKPVDDDMKKETESALHIYPNPATNYIIVELKNVSDTKLNYEIISSDGRLMVSDLLNLTSNIALIDVSNIPSASYHLIIYSNKQKLYTEKIQIIKYPLCI